MNVLVMGAQGRTESWTVRASTDGIRTTLDHFRRLHEAGTLSLHDLD